MELFYTDVSAKPTSSPGSCKDTPDPAQALNTIEDSRFITPSKEEDEPATFGDVLVQAALRDRWAEEHHAQLPIRYNVFVIEESFLEIQHKAPQLVEQTAEGAIRLERDLPHREAIESSRLAGASMIADGVWVSHIHCTIRNSLTSPSFSLEMGEMILSDRIEPHRGLM